MKNDKFIQMQIFCRVIETGGFTAAAKSLSVSQSMISKAMKNLENRLGVSLLRRTTREQQITFEGERYLRDCRKILDMIEVSEDSLTSHFESVAGKLKISAPLSFGLDQINPIIPNFMQQHPNVEIELSLNDQIENMLQENIDIAIRMGQLEDSTLLAKRLCRLHRVIVASPYYLEINSIPESPRDLDDHNCLMWKGNAQHLNNWPFYKGNKKFSVMARGKFQTDNGLSLTKACLDGLGIMRMAEHIAIPLIRSGKLVQLLSNHQQHDDQAVQIVFSPEKQNLSRVRVFVDFCIAHFRSLNWADAKFAPPL